MRRLAYAALMVLACACVAITIRQISSHHWHDALFWAAAWLLFVYAAVEAYSGGRKKTEARS